MATVSRRVLLSGLGAAVAAADKVAEVLQVNDLDRRIWHEELEEFVPMRMWDMHSHLSLYKFNTSPTRNQDRPAKLNAAELEKKVKSRTEALNLSVEKLEKLNQDLQKQIAVREKADAALGITNVSPKRLLKRLAMSRVISTC